MIQPTPEFAASDASTQHTRQRSGLSSWRIRGSRGLVTTSLLVIAVAGVGAVAATIVAGVMTRPAASSETPQAHAPEPSRVSESTANVKVVCPRRDADSSITVEQLAIVEPYYRADLRARASGIVKAVHGDIGNRVRRGDVLIEIDVPESEQDVAQKGAMVDQRQHEVKLADARLKDTRAACAVSAATIKQRAAEVQALLATRDLKRKRFDRFKELAKKGTVVGNLVDEEERDYLASESAVVAAQANVERARADHAESESRVETATADVELKEAQVNVALADLERAKAVADFGRVTAPIDGVIVRRAVDPGSFVQNATSGASESLISVARTDIVTVRARFPDSAAALIARDTPTTVQIDDLPGTTIATRVTRYSPWIQDTDRTMQVEVDLFNGTEAEYQHVLQEFASDSGRCLLKGADDPVPERAFSDRASSNRRILPGMTGTLKLSIGGGEDSWVLPSTCVYSRSGANYILVAEGGRTRQLPVRVQLNDGKVARVLLVSEQAGGSGRAAEVLSGLCGHEQVVAARQLEIGDGANVRVTVIDW